MLRTTLQGVVLLPQRQRQQPRESARLPMRQAVWDSKSGFQDTPVFDFLELEAGNTIEGPALIEAKETTYVIEPEWKFTLDCFHNAILEQV